MAGALDRIARPVFGRELAAAIPGAAHGVTIHAASEINRMLAEHFAAAEAGSVAST